MRATALGRATGLVQYESAVLLVYLKMNIKRTTLKCAMLGKFLIGDRALDQRFIFRWSTRDSEALEALFASLGVWNDAAMFCSLFRIYNDNHDACLIRFTEYVTALSSKYKDYPNSIPVVDSMRKQNRVMTLLPNFPSHARGVYSCVAIGLLSTTWLILECGRVRSSSRHATAWSEQ